MEGIFICPKSIKQDRDIKYRLQEKKNQRKNDRNKIISKNRQIDKTDMNGTYVVPEDGEKGSNRRKLLDLWRKERDQKLLEERNKLDQRPVFKVCHLDNKPFESMSNRPCLCQSLHATRSVSNLTSAQSMINLNSNNSLQSRNGAITRSLSRKINRTVDSMKTAVSNNVKSFAEAAKAASKFTFQAFLVKKTKKQPPQTKPTKEIDSEEILICSSSSTVASSIAPVQYEDFCGSLFFKDDEKYTYETAQYGNIVEDEETKSKKRTSKRSSYRKSKSGMYKVDIQSSILELDDYDEQTSSIPAAPSFKLETIVEQPQSVFIFEQLKQEPVENPIEPEEEEKVIKIEEEEGDYFEMNGEKRDVKFYRNLVVLETRLLNECSAKWDSCIDEAPEDVQGDIRSAIGLAKLLIDERFVQFIELVDQSEFKTGDKPVKCSDLQGFWDMVDFQVIDVKKKFTGLEKLKENKYVEELVVFKPVKKVTKPATEKKPATSTTAAVAAAKRSKFADFKAQMMKSKQEAQNEDQKENEQPIIIESNQKPVIGGTPLKKIETNTVQHLRSIEKQIVFKHQMRQSDSIKFDDETPNCKRTKASLTKIHSIEGDEDEDDFLKLGSFKPISWRNSVTNSNEMIIDITNSLNFNLNIINTPKTPRNRKSLFSQQNGSTDISKSPLLKLAYISSHGKRLSRSGQV